MAKFLRKQLGTRLLALAAAPLLLAGCGQVAAGSVDPNLGKRELRVVTTTGMITDLVEHVGGDRVDVDGLMGPGVDPHLYKATEGDVIRLADADVVLYNGLHLEAKLSEVFERMGGRVRTVAVTDGMPQSQLIASAAFGAAYDPHVWFDVRLWMGAVREARDALAALDPAHTATYEANAARYLADLAELDRYVRRRAAEVPRERRVIITAHDAFNYFGRAYGFEVGIGGSLFSDAMGDPDTPEGTYVGMVRHNVDTIVDGLKREVEG